MNDLYVGYTAPVNRVGREIWIVEYGLVVAVHHCTDAAATLAWVHEQTVNGTHAAYRSQNNAIVLYRAARWPSEHRGYA
jgi:hypothetical protein